jgi:hypothetical protein
VDQDQEQYPMGGGMELINDAVSSIRGTFDFTLSGGDSAGATGTFIITPEPATLALLGLGAVGVLRRRRR